MGVGRWTGSEAGLEGRACVMDSIPRGKGGV